MAIQIPIGQEAEHRGVINLVSMTATTYAPGSTAGETGPIPDELAESAQAAREALIDVVAENDDSLIEKYLEGQEITTEELIGGDPGRCGRGADLPGRLRGGRRRDRGGPALDLLIEALPSPVDVGAWTALDPDSGEPVTVTLSENGSADGLLLQDPRRPVQRPHQPAARLLGRAAQRQPRHLRAQRLRRSGWDSSSRSRARTTSRCRRSAPGTSARWPS